MRIRAWISAFRLRTLPLAISCVLMGGAMAALDNALRPGVMALAGLTTILLQILSNLANDLGDTLKGVDNENRVGPVRATQSGAISAGQMKTAVIIFALLALLSGLGLLWMAIGSLNNLFFGFLSMGLVAIAAAMAYTMGKRPYGYMGLGDAFVLLFFGFVGVGGSAILISGFTDWTRIFPGLTIGLLAAAVLNLNNMRDAENDLLHGKLTLAARLGFGRAKIYHTAILLLSAASWIIFVLIIQTPLLFLALVPMATVALHLRKVHRISEPVELDPELKKIALTAFLISLLVFVMAITG